VEVTNSNGAVTVNDIDGVLRLRNRFGRVAVTKVSRGVTLHNSNGEVQRADAAGLQRRIPSAA
jgi:hypothetical protein